jgi:hypothetical protein
MNRIVREHYPASRLPDDLREGIDPSQDVTVTVVVEPVTRGEDAVTLDEVRALRRPPFLTKEDIDSHIRQLRDEWDG